MADSYTAKCRPNGGAARLRASCRAPRRGPRSSRRSPRSLPFRWTSGWWSFTPPCATITAGVSGLRQEDFRIFEDGVPQPIRFFQHEDVPVAVGLVVDDSGSMRPKRKT